MSWEQRNADFCNAQTDAQMAYIEAEREVDRLQTENAKLRELVRDYERCTMHADCAGCEYDGKLSTHCPLSPCFPDTDKLDEMEGASRE